MNLRTCLFTILIPTLLFLPLRADNLERFDRFIEHMSSTYYQPMGLEVDDVGELFRKTSTRFAAITLGYGLSKQASLVRQDTGRHIIFQGLIDESLNYLMIAAESELSNAAGGNADPQAVKDYQEELEHLFTAALGGYVDKQVEGALGAPPRVDSIFEEDAWQLTYPKSIPPVEYLAVRWNSIPTYDGKIGGQANYPLLTLATGKYGYIIADRDEQRYGKATIKYWRIEGDKMLHITWGGWVAVEMTFKVEEDRWVFEGPMYEEDGTQVKNRSTGAMMGLKYSQRIPDRFIVKVKGAGTGAPPPSQPVQQPADTPKPGEAVKPLRETDEPEPESSRPEPPDPVHDPLAVGVLLKELRTNALKLDFWKVERMLTGNAVQQLQYAKEWRGRNPRKFKAYSKVLPMAGITFGDPQFSNGGRNAIVTGKISIFGFSLPFTLEALELEIVDGEWKVSNIQYTRTPGE